MKKFIWIKTEKEMIHCYPGAPEKVSYLRNEHRHLFKIKVFIEICKSREIEFIMFKHYIQKLLDTYNMIENVKFSCEDVSDYLFEQIKGDYPFDREIRIEVSEDGENGCYCEYPES